MSEMFLTREEIAELTGRKTKSKQIAQLRTMALPFWVNAIGYPIVARSTVEGKPAKASEQQESEKWVPAILRKKALAGGE